jgi:cytochrome c oxidase subunit 2
MRAPNAARRFATAALAVAGLVLAGASAASAMPPFAEAYGIKCSVCHTQVPALNAYGRYIQRTGYGTLDARAMHRSTPFWVGETVNYSHSSQDGSSSRTEFGNVALHAAGALDANTTFHIQQWIVQDGMAGGLDTAWITYNNLFHRSGHLFVGKMPGTTASPLSQWFDIAAFGTPELTVGEHLYQNDGNRWGSKFAYVKNALDVEAGYFAGSGDLGDLGKYSPDIEKTFQWRVAHADPQQPLEYGIMGARGSFPLAEGGFDQYTSLTPYVQRDPVGGAPGIFAMYHMAYDGNAGQDAFGDPLGAARANAATVELYEPLGDKGLIAFRKEFQNDGLGTRSQTGNVDLAYDVAPFLHLYLETAMAQNAPPTFSYMLWWTLPLQKVRAPDRVAAPVSVPVAASTPETAPETTSEPASAATARPAIDVVASNWKFAPNAITLVAGQTTRIHLTSSSGVHGLQSAELGIPLTVIEPGKGVTIDVTPTKPGTYVLHCAILCGAGHENMVLTIVVTAPQTH